MSDGKEVDDKVLLGRQKFHAEKDGVVVLSLTVEWGVGMERQGPSYGEVVSTKDVRVQALLGRSNSPTSRSPEAVEWIMNV